MRSIVIITAASLGLLTLACGSSETKKKSGAPEAQLLGIEIHGDAEVEKLDLNGDEKPDVWKHYVRRGSKDLPPEKRPKLLARQDLDLNFDHTVDVRRHFNAAGQVVREEMDLDFDGMMDAIDYYSDGTLYRRDLSLNFKGTPSIMKFYNDGKLTRKELDTNEDSTMDTIEYYQDEKLVRIGKDRDGDGKPDVYTEIGEGT